MCEQCGTDPEAVDEIIDRLKRERDEARALVERWKSHVTPVVVENHQLKAKLSRLKSLWGGLPTIPKFGGTSRKKYHEFDERCNAMSVIFNAYHWQHLAEHDAALLERVAAEAMSSEDAVADDSRSQGYRDALGDMRTEADRIRKEAGIDG